MSRFFATAEHLMRKRHFNDISVEDFASAADASVGAFYKRFEDKSSFFRAIQTISKEEYRMLVARWPVAFSQLDFQLLNCVEIIVDTVLTHFQNREGYIRSAIRRPRNQNDWLPHVEAGRLGFDAAMPLANYIAGDLDAQRKQRLIFGIQSIYSIALLAADDDPVEGALHDPELPGQLVDLTYAYWTAQPRRA